MKKLNINKCYEDANIILNSKFKKEPVSIIIRNTNFTTPVTNAIIFVGERDSTIEQANQILKIYGLNYELVDEVNWKNIKKGTKVRYVYDKLMNGMIEHTTKTTFEITNKSYTNLYTNGTFYDFVSETNQILILVGDNIIVKNASEVKLV